MKTNMVKYFWACALVLAACSREDQGARSKVESGSEEETAASIAAAEASEIGDAEKGVASSQEGQLQWSKFERRPQGQSYIAYKCSDYAAGGQVFILRLTRLGQTDTNEALNRRCASTICHRDSVTRNHVAYGEVRQTKSRCGVEGTYTRQ